MFNTASQMPFLGKLFEHCWKFFMQMSNGVYGQVSTKAWNGMCGLVNYISYTKVNFSSHEHKLAIVTTYRPSVSVVHPSVRPQFVCLPLSIYKYEPISTRLWQIMLTMVSGMSSIMDLNRPDQPQYFTVYTLASTKSNQSA